MSTTLPSPEAPAVATVPPIAAEDRPRSLTARSTDDVLSVVGSVVGSFALVYLIYFEILPLSGLVGFIICWFAAFLAMYAGVTGLSHPRPVVVSRLMGAVVTGAAVLIGFALVTVVVYTVVNGRHAVAHLNFFTHDMAGVGVQAPLTQ
jgi:phosphate transport system permease protein